MSIIILAFVWYESRCDGATRMRIDVACHPYCVRSGDSFTVYRESLFSDRYLHFQHYRFISTGNDYDINSRILYTRIFVSLIWECARTGRSSAASTHYTSFKHWILIGNQIFFIFHPPLGELTISFVPCHCFIWAYTVYPTLWRLTLTSNGCARQMNKKRTAYLWRRFWFSIRFSPFATRKFIDLCMAVCSMLALSCIPLGNRRLIVRWCSYSKVWHVVTISGSRLQY